MRAAWPALACLLLCSCVTYRTQSTRASTEVGATTVVPAGFASGQSTARWLFGFGPFGSDDPAVAIERARGKALEMSLSDVTVERQVTCVFECGWPLYRSVTVLASGSLLMPRGYRDPEKPAAAAPALSPRHPAPSADALVERLKSFYLSDPEEAESYYESLADDTRQSLGAQVFALSGLTPLYGDVYRVPASATAQDCRFLEWFLQEHSIYRLSADSCR